jgi:hypothetical protein
MSNLLKKYPLHWLFNFFIGLGIVLIMFFNPLKILTAEKTNKKVQVELFVGFSTLNPADFNLLADYERQFQWFQYDVYYDYLKTRYEPGTGTIRRGRVCPTKGKSNFRNR